MDCRARSTASLPERVHSARIPTLTSIFVTLSQVLKSSSTTRAFRPSSSVDLFHRAVLCLHPQRHTNDKLAALALRCLHLDGAAHHIHDIFGNGHAKAGTCIRLTVEVRSRSRVQRSLRELLAHTNAVVLIRNSYCPQPRTLPASCRTRTETVPPAGVNLMALDSRFSRIWFSRVLSQ